MTQLLAASSGEELPLLLLLPLGGAQRVFVLSEIKAVETEVLLR